MGGFWGFWAEGMGGIGHRGLGGLSEEGFTMCRRVGVSRSFTFSFDGKTLGFSDGSGLGFSKYTRAYDLACRMADCRVGLEERVEHFVFVIVVEDAKRGLGV